MQEEGYHERLRQVYETSKPHRSLQEQMDDGYECSNPGSCEHTPISLLEETTAGRFDTAFVLFIWCLKYCVWGAMSH